MPSAPMEPYRIKMVERIEPTTRAQRAEQLRQARYNLFRIPSRFVAIDLLTDSGTSAMSDRQWAAMLVGDEAYAASRSFEHFQETIRRIFGFWEVIPTHQGRAAEHLLFTCKVRPGEAVPNNSHFDTTRANIEAIGAEAVDCVVDCAYTPSAECLFKGNVDLEKLDRVLRERRVPLGMVTLTNNAGGGQPVSLKNLRDVSKLLHDRGIPLFLDAARIAENAWFIRKHEAPTRSIAAIVGEVCALADGCTMSAKKDGLANIGGFLACRDSALADEVRRRMVLTEGFPTYGGLAGRDLEAIAVGLEEAMDLAYLDHRIGQIRYLAELLQAEEVPIVKPPGGHAAFIDARALLPHIRPGEFPGQALACELYLEAGIRSCEIGSLMFGGHGGPAPRLDLVRLAIPRRVYTSAHLEAVAEAVGRVARRADSLKGLRIVKEPPFLRHFSADLEPLMAEGVAT